MPLIESNDVTNEAARTIQKKWRLVKPELEVKARLQVETRAHLEACLNLLCIHFNAQDNNTIIKGQLSQLLSQTYDARKDAGEIFTRVHAISQFDHNIYYALNKMFTDHVGDETLKLTLDDLIKALESAKKNTGPDEQQNALSGAAPAAGCVVGGLAANQGIHRSEAVLPNITHTDQSQGQRYVQNDGCCRSDCDCSSCSSIVSSVSNAASECLSSVSNCFSTLFRQAQSCCGGCGQVLCRCASVACDACGTCGQVVCSCLSEGCNVCSSCGKACCDCMTVCGKC